ncbi:MAG: response regulator [Luteibaculaceae bacterium]
MVKILIVEDDSFSALLLGKLLGDRYKVTTADTVDLAYEYLTNNTFDLILTDINLGISRNEGLELLEKIKSANFENPPIVAACTAYATDDEKKKILDAGFDYFFKKPIKAEEINQLVKHKLDKIGY